MILDTFSLEGKVAIVTGSKRGIGKAIALALAEAGADVVVTTRNVEGDSLEAVSRDIRKKGRASIAIQADVSKKHDMERLMDTAMNEFGRIDILVNNAGVMQMVPLLEQSEEDWRRTIDTDLTGYFLCAQAAGKVMVAQKRGSIINITSIRALRPRKNIGAYCVAKAGQNMLAKALAFELAQYNIRVNCVAPSMVETEMTKEMLGAPGFMDNFLPQVPLARLGLGSDMAGATVFLASDAASYITGQIIYVDGGQLI
jgi:NAD(P)-dependent dehydrogenase (short-subunit alcohol dehydrogenase family)